VIYFSGEDKKILNDDFETDSEYKRYISPELLQEMDTSEFFLSFHSNAFSSIFKTV